MIFFFFFHTKSRNFNLCTSPQSLKTIRERERGCPLPEFFFLQGGADVHRIGIFSGSVGFFFSVHGKSEFQLPPNLGTALEDGHFDHLEDCMVREHYRQRLHMLLHIEEFERRRQMTRFYNYF